jgi:hypothetical protein
MLARAILTVIVALLSLPAVADTKTFVGLKLSCTGGYRDRIPTRFGDSAAISGIAVT